MTNPTSPCIEAGIAPLMAELRTPVRLRHANGDGAMAAGMRDFVRAAFARCHGASVNHFHPELMGFDGPDGTRAVLGYRGGDSGKLFSEQYLEHPAHRVIELLLDTSVARGDLVEVGNFALAQPGAARWVIAATTSFLAAAGYRWVLFTANRPLANAFRRLGLKPLLLCEANPARLPDGGRAWGRYYDGAPSVYAGDILAGERKLIGASRTHTPELRALLADARALGASLARGDERIVRTRAAS